jgi:hypothetical protein
MEFALSQTSFELLKIFLPARAGASLIIANARKIRLLLLQYETPPHRREEERSYRGG